MTKHLIALVAVVMTVVLVSGAEAAAPGVPLGTANSFAILAGAGITNTGPTTVTGDIGTYPTKTTTGTTSITIHGANHHSGAVTQGAKTSLVTAYNIAAGEGPTSPIAADLVGLNLGPGVYNSASSIALSGKLILNAHGNPDATFVFQAGSSLTTASGSSVKLVNGARACNVFWQVGSSATLGTGSTFRGTILALHSITVTTGVTVYGRVLARNGSVTLDTDTIHRAICAPDKSEDKGKSNRDKDTTAHPAKHHFGLTG
jgi:Ice-binding-like